MPNLRISLDQEGPYFSGSSVSGKVLLALKKPKGSYRQISIHITGMSHVEWEEKIQTRDVNGEFRTETRKYTSTETYVNLFNTLWSSKQSPDGKLATGQYSWPFDFKIPTKAPSSFEGTVGKIHYTLLSKISHKVTKPDHTEELRLSVLQPVKITDSHLLKPKHQEVQKTICCLCCASQPIILTVAVPKTGFCAGESFQLHASLENGSNCQVTVAASITKRVVYHAQGHSHTNEHDLLSVSSGAIEPRATHEWDPTFEIPVCNVPVMYSKSCNNIKITYTLNVSCQIPRAFDLLTQFPLMLGNSLA